MSAVNTIPTLHVRLEGISASFRHPLTISGTQVSSPMPAYSNLLGLISACAGRIVGPKETRIGFEFRAQSYDLELERTERWIVDKKGNLRPHPKGQGIVRRQVYWHPILDIYITSKELKKAFENPAATPCLGRSQDIAWIIFVREIFLESRVHGDVGPTLVPMPQPGVPGLILRLPEWMENTRNGFPRRSGPFGIFQAMVPTSTNFYKIERGNLYHPSDSDKSDHVIYLHAWANE